MPFTVEHGIVGTQQPILLYVGSIASDATYNFAKTVKKKWYKLN